MAETAILVTIGVALASGILREVAKRAIDAASESSTVSSLKSVIFGNLEDDLLRVGKELSSLDCVLRSNSFPQHDDNNPVFIWLEDVKEVACFADNMLDEIAYHKIREEVRIRTSPIAKRMPRFDACFRMRIAGKINKFFTITSDIYKKAEKTLTLVKLGREITNNPQPAKIFTNVSDIRENLGTSIVLGRKEDEDVIVAELCNQHNNPNLSITVVVGRSGVGKTTLARIVYDNVDVRKHFGKRTWISVSDHFKLERFLDEMLQSVRGSGGHNLTNIGAMEDQLQESLKGEKWYLIVLDDVWNTNEDLWNSVQSSLLRISRSTRCRVLVTTQSTNVAAKMDASLTHKLRELENDDAWKLFYQLALANKSDEQILNLEDVGKQILNKCGGLPLAITAMGSLLRSKDVRSEWESIEKSEMWGLRLDQSKVMPWLVISFNHLGDAAIKQCFVHCSVIIEKGKFVNESEVFQAWMAQGFIQSTGSNLSMEDICETYVSNMVDISLLQRRIEYDNDLDRSTATYDPGVCSLWMHDLVHDMARFISKGTSWILRDDSDLYTVPKAEHLQICGDFSSDCQYNLPKGKILSKLRTLICYNATLSIDFKAQAKFLRDLRLVFCNLEEVPSSIGGLKHLRYLSLSNNPLRKLHESKSITTLFNLQTLDLNNCYPDTLPQSITKLSNLRHILAWNVKIPKGVGQLTCLRTLPPIELGLKEGFEIKELKSLEFLSGELRISGLEHITSKQEANEASLKTKTRIRYLGLQWLNSRGDNDDEIIEELQPHSELKGIHVRDFSGKKLPSWLLHMHNLRTMNLQDCEACEQLPTLGHLGSLEEIRIIGMNSLEVIGLEFYHKDEERVIRRRKLFPRLKRLFFLKMDKLRDWAEPSSSVYEVFPCLEKLELWGCPLLVNAPTCIHSLSTLSITMIRSGEVVTKLLTNTSNLTHLYIESIEELTSLFRPGCLELGALRTLQIEGCPNLDTIHGLQDCLFIEKLSLKGISKRYVVPHVLGRLNKLRVFDFS